MNKGCGCLGFTAAVAAGLIIGVIGLSAAGYYWVNTRVLADAPEDVFRDKWTKVDEASLASKLAPLALLAKQNKEGEQKVSLKGSEANRLADECVKRTKEDIQTALTFGDTVTDVCFSRQMGEGKYLNGEMRADIKGANGDYEVKVYSLRTGEFDWPAPMLAGASRWIEGALETQMLFKDCPFRLMDYETGKNQLKLTIRVVKQDKTSAESSPP